ncbi:ABC-three component system protein [Kitasatospora sp. CB01950]|uniref:ABC-three component system protein n=1 Tax=Kitasatospora sp. CB01950 TaxID=1703930 RepID=UPI0011613AD5|nr:ABC-three component system protein [Kitasatospora sp. CB01950]
MSVSQYAVPAALVPPNRFDRRTPLQQVWFWEPDEWERFTCEWVRMRAPEEGYLGTEIIGGSNDRGADVVAFFTERRLNGEWHCFQCKLYQDELEVADALPEMVKPFVAAVETTRTLPTRYTFVAPRIHPRLKDLVLTPDELKFRFLEYLRGRTQTVAKLPAQLLGDVVKLAEATEFSMFWTINLDEMLEVYSKSPLFAARFNYPPSGAPAKLPVPSEPAAGEARFLAQLVDVYQERYGRQIVTVDDAFTHARSRDHLRRQREAFYAAEELRLYARDSVPGDAYAELQDDVLVNLVEVADDDHESGWHRLRAVVTQAGNLQVSGSAIASYFRQVQRKGMCHQFANDDKLTWCDGGER